MTRKKLDFRGQAFKDVLGFTFLHWAKQPWRIFVITALALLSALADVLTPMFAGRLVDAIASGSAGDAVAWHAAITAFCVLGALGLGATLFRQGVFFNIIRLTLKMMSEIAANAFHRVQRFSTDWHANSFAGSTVRKITRGMWALDLLNDTLLIALLPSLVMLVGATMLLGWRWPMMGAVVGIGSMLYIAVTVAMSLGFVAPAARLANAWDTRMGGALADAVSCNGVVKAFGAEAREEVLLERVIVKWRHRTRRTWMRGTINGGLQGGMLVAIQAAILGAALLLWVRGEASVGDITFALTMFFMLQGYLRDVGMHIRNLQRSVNDMEELVSLESQPLGIEDRPGAGPIAIGKGEIRFEHVTFHYGAKATPLYDNFSVRIAPGERVGLVGHSGSGKTTFIKLIQRLYDISEGRITIDGQDIARVRQASLRSQIAIVQQEPVLFHRSLRQRREARQCARLYRDAASGLRHAGGRTRHQALGWRTSARGYRAGVSRGRADPDSGRSDLEPRQRKRSADPARHGTADDGPHDAGGGTPPFHRASAGPAAGVGQGQGHRGRQSRGVDQTRERPVQAAVRTSGAGVDQGLGRFGCHAQDR
jgi:ATP-binding cassette subfamily B protein